MRSLLEIVDVLKRAEHDPYLEKTRGSPTVNLTFDQIRIPDRQKLDPSEKTNLESNFELKLFE